MADLHGPPHAPEVARLTRERAGGEKENLEPRNQDCLLQDPSSQAGDEARSSRDAPPHSNKLPRPEKFNAAQSISDQVNPLLHSPAARLAPCLTCLIENPEVLISSRCPSCRPPFPSSQQTNFNQSRAVCVAQQSSSSHNKSHLSGQCSGKKITPHQTPPPPSFWFFGPRFQKPSSTKTFSNSTPGLETLLATYNILSRLTAITSRRTPNQHPDFLPPTTYPRWISATKAGPASLVSLPSPFPRSGFCLPRGSERNCRHPPTYTHPHPHSREGGA